MYDTALRDVLLLELGASPLEGSLKDGFATESLDRKLKENIPLVADYSSILKRVTALGVYANDLYSRADRFARRRKLLAQNSLIAW
jgi:hypothetical protein